MQMLLRLLNIQSIHHTWSIIDEHCKSLTKTLTSPKRRMIPTQKIACGRLFSSKHLFGILIHIKMSSKAYHINYDSLLVLDRALSSNYIGLAVVPSWDGQLVVPSWMLVHADVKSFHPVFFQCQDAMAGCNVEAKTHQKCTTNVATQIPTCSKIVPTIYQKCGNHLTKL